MTQRVPYVIADFDVQLATAVSIGATSFTLSSATDDDGNALPSGLYCFTIDNGNSAKEYLLGSLSGTTVSSVKSISRQGVETTGASIAHRAGASVIMTDFIALTRVADTLRGAQNLDGSAPLSYDATPTLSDPKQLATVQYVLDVATGGSLYFSSQTISAVAGETLVAGDVVYFKEADQRWWKTDADTSATFLQVKLGVSLGSASAGNAVTIQISGIADTFTSLTAGSKYYLSNTAGGVSTSAGTTEVFFGIATSTTAILMAPREIYMPSATQYAAMAGTTGTPSSTNPFMTRTDNRAGLQKSVTAGETIAGATTPVPVYQNKTDNQFYACDGNDLTKLKFVGFAISNGTDNNSMDMQFGGIVSGFTALDEGEKYYLSDTAGAISSSPGTYEVLVGVAISPTELLIQKGKRRASGTESYTVDATTTITVGFRVSRVRIEAVAAQGSSNVIYVSSGGWTVFGGNKSVWATSLATSSAQTSTFAASGANGSNSYTITINNITDTTFDIVYDDISTFAPTVSVFWEAEGEQ